jgi:hypothetical protein
MPDRDRIAGEIQALLSQPKYASMFQHRNQFMNPGPNNITPEGLAHAAVLKRRGDRPGPDLFTPEVIAKETATRIWKDNFLLNPVEVLELRGPLELYRAYDGGVRVKSAGTLGQSWFECLVMESIWKATARFQDEQQRDFFMDLLRCANFVLPEWNDMIQIARMAVPHGNTVVVVRGRGDWKAMKTPSNKSRPNNAPRITTAIDVEIHLGMMALPGTIQCVVPLFNDNWVNQVDKKSRKWPFRS